MRIGVYGGSFNPPHIGHLQTARLAATRANLDTVLFVPAREPYMKTGIEMATFEQRFAMTARALSDIQTDHTRYVVTRVEAEREGPSIMADTMEDIFKKIQPNSDKLFLIIGSDSYASLSSWRKLEKLLNLCELIVVDRQYRPIWSVRVDDYIREHVAVFTEYVVDVSSTSLREALKKEEPECMDYIPELTRDYILKNHLYGT